MRRVVVTGLGLVTPLGGDVETTWQNLIAGKSGAQRVTDDQRPMFRGELKTIAADAATALARTTDRDSRLHLEDVRDQIAKILDPKFQLVNPTPAQAIPLPLSDNGDIFCWTDYAIE